MSLSNRITNDFHFRTKDGYKRPSVQAEFDSPSAEGIISLVSSEDTKVVAFVEDLVSEALKSHIKGFIEADLEFNQESLEALAAGGSVSIEHIAHIPKADRTSLTKDDLETFAADYIAVMPELTGKELARVQGAASLFVERFKRAAGDPDVLSLLQQQLAVFVDGVDAEILERNTRVCTWAATKLEELLSIKITADAL